MQTVAHPPLHATKDPSMAKHRADDQPVPGTDEFEHEDGTVYVRVDPAQFPLWDERDSTLVEEQ